MCFCFEQMILKLLCVIPKLLCSQRNFTIATSLRYNTFSIFHSTNKDWHFLKFLWFLFLVKHKSYQRLFVPHHKLWTPNEGIHQRNLKIRFGPMRQAKYAPVVSKNLEVGVDFCPYSEDDFLIWHP